MLQMLNFDDPNQNPISNSPQQEMNLNYRNIQPPQTANNFYRPNNQNNQNLYHENNLKNVNLPNIHKQNMKRNNLNISSDNQDQEGIEMDNYDGMQPKVYEFIYYSFN